MRMRYDTTQTVAACRKPPVFPGVGAFFNQNPCQYTLESASLLFSFQIHLSSYDDHRRPHGRWRNDKGADLNSGTEPTSIFKRPRKLKGLVGCGLSPCFVCASIFRPAQHGQVAVLLHHWRVLPRRSDPTLVERWTGTSSQADGQAISDLKVETNGCSCLCLPLQSRNTDLILLDCYVFLHNLLASRQRCHNGARWHYRI